MTKSKVRRKFTTEEIFTLFCRFEYDRRECIVINRSSDQFGGLLNMTGGYPLIVNGVMFNTLEHLYQILRFPALPRVQKKIVGKASPLLAKWVAKPHRKKGRPDWFEVKFEMMWWCLHVKLAQHYERFGALLEQSGNRVIVETSPDGDLWGGTSSRIESKPHILAGSNVFGKLLMRLREEYRTRSKKQMTVVNPIEIDDFLLFGKQIGQVGRQ